MLTFDEKQIQAALDEASVISLVQELVRRPSVSGDERLSVEHLAAVLDDHGLEVRLKDAATGRPNLFCRWGADDGPTLLLTGHSDTVPIGEGWSRDPFGGAIDEGRLYGRGSCDMKAGLAGMALAMIAIKQACARPKGAVVFAACVDEEVTGIGTQAAIRAGLTADWAVIGEPTELQPIRACKGNCYFEVEISGRAAHAGSPERGVNAIYGAMEAVAATRRHAAEIAGHRHALLGSPSLSVGTISGGLGVSIVPDKCSFWVDRRLLPGETGEAALAAYRDALERYTPAVAGLSRHEWLRMELPPSEIDDGHPLVAALATAARDSGAPDLAPGGWSAASDGGYLMRDAGIPTVLFGPGSIVNQAHRPDEFVPVDEVLVAARTYLTLATRALDSRLQPTSP
jgi:acetylornithine deacetylase/succinyl-diaminopimelate desuccinylase family protein